MSLRGLLKQGFYRVQRRAARLRGRRPPPGSPRRIVVFAMHTITSTRSDMAVAPQRFEAQLRGLLESGYRAVSIADLLVALKGTSPLAGPAFAVTFDDGYRSVYTHALPILESLQIPAAVFLTTGFLDRSTAPPWRSTDPALLAEYRTQFESFRPLSWDEARALAQHPLISIGSHSVSHPLLAACTVEDARREIAESRAIIGDRLGCVPDLFAYPFGVRRYGAYSTATEALVRDSGYRCSFTSEISRARAGAGPWLIPRISLTDDDAPADALAKAAGGYDWVAAAQGLYQSVFPSPHGKFSA